MSNRFLDESGHPFYNINTDSERYYICNEKNNDMKRRFYLIELSEDQGESTWAVLDSKTDEIYGIGTTKSDHEDSVIRLEDGTESVTMYMPMMLDKGVTYKNVD